MQAQKETEKDRQKDEQTKRDIGDNGN